MHRGVFHGFQVRQMVGGNPSWWEMNTMRPPPPQTTPLLPSSSSTSSLSPQHPQPSNFLPMTRWHDNQGVPETWSQLLLEELVEEENRCSFTTFQAKKVENWEDQALYQAAIAHNIDVKQEKADSGYINGHGSEEIQAAKSLWSQIVPTSSPRSCVTASFSRNMLDFSDRKNDRKYHQPDHSSECNSTAAGSPFKKARVQSSSAQSTFKVRKEKLGDRITALHQLVSPFGKTDTASVLLEAIGYIRFLQSQIEALSSSYLVSGSASMSKPAPRERSCIFPEDPGQLLNDPSCMKRTEASDQEANNEPKKDLRSRGLCLVPVSCTMHVGSDSGADYWAPTFSGGFR